ncbi:hypothetical protein AX774_g3470 [Zancudomyces culisetae]|uniref:Uncharacterized protein n=1 Tax=Zancudomyces culisetae TaxID=1213189 RepID=A0A1R1PQ04_ZANCU|nr:hypothetical protein AX774_g3470 [Zancudomyces culisetae]|eukprot:OMH83029.1 hypothetical protein AX774_g3470 [Zancudomyces culisetae]
MILPAGTKRIKARALGASSALKAGISRDRIVDHAFLSNLSVFNNHYCLSRFSNENVSQAIPGSEVHN